MSLQFNEGDACPLCDAGKLKRTVSSATYTYKERECVIDGLVSYRCPACSEEFVVPKENAEFDRSLAEFYARVDGVLSPPEILKVRKKLNLTPEQLAALLGVTLKNYAKYESGALRPNKAVCHLLRILYKQPEAMGYLGEGGLTF